MNAITYPARPVNGGPFDKALPKSGDWYYEPKVNGWRALVHGPTRAMWNRKGEPLSVAKQFSKALDCLYELSRDTYIEWWDCEAMERRHSLAHGCLFVLDWVPTSPTHQPAWWDRKHCITLTMRIKEAIPELMTPGIYSLQTWTEGEVRETYWQKLQKINGILGCEFFEGVLAKRADSLYPIQLRSPDREFPFWMKHRWQF